MKLPKYSSGSYRISLSGESISLNEYVSSSSVEVTHIIEEYGKTELKREILQTDKINITESPVFVEAVKE